jgi:aspartate dehydrogenase
MYQVAKEDMSKLKIGIVGCGAIGSSLAKAIVSDFRDSAELTALYDIVADKAARLAQLLKQGLPAASLPQLLKQVDLVIEAASAKDSWQITQQALASGCDIMIMSVGGIISHSQELSDLAKKYKAKVYIPSGAVCGIDGLKAAELGKLKTVTLTTRKHPLSFRGVSYVEDLGINLAGITEEKILFAGPAKEAVKHFPQNINVAAVLSLAGIGQDQTQVKIIASPQAKRNIHEVEIESEAGKICTRTENVLHPDNPKTSFLAVLAAVATLRQILEPVRIGT